MFYKNLFNQVHIINNSERERETKKKGKGVPLHAMDAHGGRGGIAPTHT
jgi:hypothetical protein